MEEGIKSIVSNFPSHEREIEYLFIYNEIFRDLCVDYILCSSRVLELKKDIGKDRDKIDEYEELQQQLEVEILKLILVKGNNNPEIS